MKLNKKKRASVRGHLPSNPFVLEDLSLVGGKMIAQNKLGRLRSEMPNRNLQLYESDSEESDPEIKRLKRKAGI